MDFREEPLVKVNLHLGNVGSQVGDVTPVNVSVGSPSRSHCQADVVLGFHVGDVAPTEGPETRVYEDPQSGLAMKMEIRLGEVAPFEPGDSIAEYDRMRQLYLAYVPMGPSMTTKSDIYAEDSLETLHIPVRHLVQRGPTDFQISAISHVLSLNRPLTS